MKDIESWINARMHVESTKIKISPMQMVHLLFFYIIHKTFNHNTTDKHYNLKHLFKTRKKTYQWLSS